MKQKRDHDEIHEDAWEEKQNEWLFQLNNVLSTGLCYAKRSKGMEDLTGFGMKNSLTLPSIAFKYFNSLRDENDELKYTNHDEYMRWFVRQSQKTVDVWLYINNINLSFQMKYLKAFRKN